MQRIDGERVDVSDGRVDEIRGKQTGELIETALHVGALDVTRAIEAAQRGRRAVAAMSSYQRVANTLQPGTPRSTCRLRARDAPRHDPAKDAA